MGIELERQIVRSDTNSDQKNENASKGLLKSYGSLKKNKRLLNAYQIRTEALIRLKGGSLAFISLERNKRPAIITEKAGHWSGYKYVRIDRDMFISLKIIL